MSAHDPAALATLKAAAELVGLDLDRVLLDGARLELVTTDRDRGELERPRARAVLTVSVLLTHEQTRELLARDES